MRKKVTTLILAAVITAAVSVPAWACTPPLNPPSSPHIEFNWTPSEEFEAGIKYGVDQYLKEHPIDLAPAESETEIEAETETVAVAEAETVTPGKLYLDWAKYIPESFRNHWMSFVRR